MFFNTVNNLFHRSSLQNVEPICSEGQNWAFLCFNILHCWIRERDIRISEHNISFHANNSNIYPKMLQSPKPCKYVGLKSSHFLHKIEFSWMRVCNQMHFQFIVNILSQVERKGYDLICLHFKQRGSKRAKKLKEYGGGTKSAAQDVVLPSCSPYLSKSNAAVSDYCRCTKDKWPSRPTSYATCRRAISKHRSRDGGEAPCMH